MKIGSLLSICATSAAVLGLIRGDGTFAAPPGDHYVKVEVRGELRRGTPAQQGRPAAPLLAAGGFEFELRFRTAPPPTPELEGMIGKSVVATGTLEKSRDADGREHLVCLVDGDLKLAGNLDIPNKFEYLIGYHDLKQEQAKKMLESSGLTILEHYGPGHYFRVGAGSAMGPDLLKKLRGSDAIRYVEPHAVYEIPRGEDPPPTPKRP